MHQSQCTDGEFHRITFDTTGWKFHIFFIYRILNVDGRNTVTWHLDRIEPKTHGITFFTPDTNTADVWNSLQLFFDSEVCYFAQFQ